MESRVVSCPPCMDCVEVKTPAGFPASAPDSQRLEVQSRKYLRGAAILQNRGGLPRRSPSACRKSSSVAYGGPLAGMGLAGPSFSALTGGPVRSFDVTPAMLSIPRHTCLASSAVEPLRE